MMVDQTIFHDPESGQIGNCLQAAVASLLDVDIEEVPHFALNADWDKQLKDWLLNRRLAWFKVGLLEVPDMLCILAGTSPRGIKHVVIGRGTHTIHDPHPDRSGLKSIDSAWIFAPFLPDPEWLVAKRDAQPRGEE